MRLGAHLGDAADEAIVCVGALVEARQALNAGVLSDPAAGVDKGQLGLRVCFRLLVHLKATRNLGPSFSNSAITLRGMRKR